MLKEFRGMFYLFCAFTLAGTSVISARLVSGKLGTFTITAVSLFFALLFLIPMCFKKLIKAIPLLNGKDFFFLFIQALCGMFLFRLFLISGLYYTTAGEAGILTGATPAFTALFAIVLLKEAANGKKLLGIFSTMCGILLIQGLLSPDSNGFSVEHFLGNVLVLCAAACEASFNIISRVFVVKNTSNERPQVDPTVQTTIVSAIALILCVVPSLFEQAVPRLLEIGMKEWLALIWYGVFVTALAFIFWYSGIKRCGAFTAAAFAGMMPFTSMLLSTIVLGEVPGWQHWSGGLLIISGMIMIGTGDHSLTRKHNSA